ncbi:hypothetical protein [Streptomyces europaeiscabiei]|uniref:hypothetical protein n=1 Tax=Streptomyces europaeiscabiei TaxID=146819 RepID=UPI002E17817F
MAVNKIKFGRALKALKAAGMSSELAFRYVAMLDLDSPLKPQIVELAEEMPDMFGLDDTDTDEDEDDTPMSAREAKVARLKGVHRLAPSNATGTTAAERNAAALGALRERSPRPTSAPATAQKAADRLRSGVGRSADN